MKKEEKTELTKEKIMQAAMEEFGIHGYSGSALNSICNKHGISKGLLYHNFTGKDELYLLCVQKCFSAVIAYMKVRNTHLDLHQYLELRFQYFAENPLCSRIFFEAMLQPPKELSKKIKQLKQDFDLFHLHIYHTALSNMTLRAGVTEQEALGYFEFMQEMFNGYFSCLINSGASMSSVITEHENKLAKMLDFMLLGITEKAK